MLPVPTQQQWFLRQHLEGFGENSPVPHARVVPLPKTSTLQRPDWADIGPLHSVVRRWPPLKVEINVLEYPMGVNRKVFSPPQQDDPLVLTSHSMITPSIQWISIPKSESTAVLSQVTKSTLRQSSRRSRNGRSHDRRRSPARSYHRSRSLDDKPSKKKDALVVKSPAPVSVSIRS